MRESEFQRLQEEIKALRGALALLERRRDDIVSALDADAADVAGTDPVDDKPRPLRRGLFGHKWHGARCIKTHRI